MASLLSLGISMDAQLGTIALVPIADGRTAMQREAFVNATVDMLQQQAIGQWTLTHWLNKLATPRDSNGEWAEFGVFNGRSIRILSLARQRLRREAGRPGRPVHGFDWFNGIPDDWHAYAKAGSYNSTKHGPPFDDPLLYTWHVGLFNATVPPFAAGLVRNVTFAHIDCDLGNAAMTVLSTLAPRLAPGAWLQFDELVNYPTFEEGEMKALYAFLLDTGRRARIVAAAGPRVLRWPPSPMPMCRGTKCPRQNALVQIL